MQNGVELVRKLGVEIVADTLRSRQIDDTNGPLQAWFPQKRRGYFFMAEREAGNSEFQFRGKAPRNSRLVLVEHVCVLQERPIPMLR